MGNGILELLYRDKTNFQETSERGNITVHVIELPNIICEN